MTRWDRRPGGGATASRRPPVESSSPRSWNWRIELAGLLFLVIAMPVGIFSAQAGAAGSPWIPLVLPVPTGSSAASLGAVSCTSATSCIAVGTTIVPGVGGAGVNADSAIWTLSGSTWSDAPAPDVSGANLASLNGISCVSPTWCVAVGEYRSNTSGVNGPLVETLSGSTWSATAVPAPAGGVEPYLTSVSCSSVASCVAVGTSYTPTAQSAPEPFVEVLAGSTWTLGALPLPQGNTDGI